MGGGQPQGGTMLLPGGTMRLDRHRGDADEPGAGAEEWSAAEPPSSEISGEILEAAVAREAVEYGELLATLKGIVNEGEGGDPAGPPGDAGGGSAAPRGEGGAAASGARPQMRDAAVGGAAPGDVPAEEPDLLAAGLMSGVEDAAEAEIRAMAHDAEAGGSPSVASLRELLRQQLGDEIFSKAHQRLQTVVEEEDDDALVADIQAILGPQRLDKLPMILKLIFLEGGGTL